MMRIKIGLIIIEAGSSVGFDMNLDLTTSSMTLAPGAWAGAGMAVRRVIVLPPAPPLPQGRHLSPRVPSSGGASMGDTAEASAEAGTGLRSRVPTVVSPWLLHTAWG